MKNIALKQIHYAGITMQVPEIWDVETEEFNEEDGTKSYSLSINAKGRDIRSIDIAAALFLRVLMPTLRHAELMKKL